jgi:hypothetical protein
MLLDNFFAIIFGFQQFKSSKVALASPLARCSSIKGIPIDLHNLPRE